MKFKKTVLGLISSCLLLLTGCSSLGLGIANVPPKLFDGNVQKAKVFDKDNNLALDIYTPALAKQNDLPVIIFFYGGRWSYGERSEYQFVATALADKGFVVVVPDYRKYPQVKFPAFVEDSAKAVQRTYNNIAEYKGQPEQLFLAGHSAGAHIGALLVSDQHYLDDIDGADAYKAIRGFAGLAGPYDFTPDEEDIMDIFGPASQYPLMQATNYIQGTEPPMLLLAGEDDTTVKLYNLERLQREITEQGGKVETKIYQGIDHVGIVGAFSVFLRSTAPVLDDVSAFFKGLL